LLRASDCWDSRIHNQISEYSSGHLWRFIQPNAQESEAEETLLNLTGLSNRDLKILADIRLLLSAEIKTLLNDIAPKIISRLSKESINEYITDRGVRGRINWQKTISTRAAAGNDTSLYVYSRRAQIFDLPENRLFLYIIRHINEKARNFVSDNYLNLTWYDEADDRGKWIDRVSVIASKSARLLRNPLVSKIGNLYELTDKIIELTKRCRPSHYKELAVTAERFAFSQNAPLYYLKDELKANIFEPLNKDTLFEIAVLFKTIQTAEECGWQEKRAGLIGGSASAVSTLAKNGWELKIYYQKLPREMAQDSKYGDIMADYGLSEKLRRPDIILEFSNGKMKKFFIVEVKRSKRRGYLVDGTYKLLGYLKDFERVNNDTAEIKGFLVGWSGIQPKDYSADKEVHLFNWNNYADGLDYLFKVVCFER
jgi:hypothetical protein